MEYRHELKFVISDEELTMCKYRIKSLLYSDKFSIQGSYSVRSLYFDDIYDTCLYQVISGVDNRDKFRLRLYNGDSSIIKLEKKSKYQNMTKKIAQIVSVDECNAYINDDDFPLMGGGVSKQLYYLRQTKNMRPKCIVEYEREAFVSDVGNVRITFDQNIRGCDKVAYFSDSSIEDYSYALDKGSHIMEVKYDELLPQYILQALDLNYLQKQSISKYAYVRQVLSGGYHE